MLTNKGKTSPQKSKILGVPTNLKSGASGSFTLEARDQYDNLQDTVEEFLIELVGPVTVPTTISNQGILSKQPSTNSIRRRHL